ncbi:MAG TPA: alkaline phosphatase family protein [Solirubrobacteraceae bacterium]|nr:alkaline phosphatase family protein [Solirubrobacteraceae bacterium]
MTDGGAKRGGGAERRGRWAEAARLPEPGAGELADAAALERLEAAAPGEGLRRREFLARTAAAAGGASLAGLLPTQQLVAEAAKRQRTRLPSPRDLPVDTFVVLMMENRSFDHYFGWRPDADGKNTGLEYPDKEGKLLPTYRLTPDFQGCGHPDPDHGWTGGRWQLNGGRNDRFVTGNEAGDGSDEFAIGYYLKEDLPFMGPASEAFQLHDRFFCSILASTYPNRHYMWSAQGGGFKTNYLPFQEQGHKWPTIFDLAIGKGVTAKYFNSDLPVSALYGARGIGWTEKVENYYARAASGTLPNISFVDPPFRDGGGGNGVSADDHPHGDIRLGQAFMSDVVHAFMESPQWERGALFVVYDEWGGFFDHVAPPRVPDDLQNNDDHFEDWAQMGFRIPALTISPYVRRGNVSHATLGFESILKLISYKFGLGHLNKRHRHANNIGRTMEWRRPTMEPPELPDPGRVASNPCSTGGDDGGFPDPQGGPRAARPKEHDLVSLETSGYLESLGYEVPPATYESIYRDPDTVRRASK